MGLQIDLNEIVNGQDSQTNFTTLLLKLIFKADCHNKALLRKGFPNAVAAVEAYMIDGTVLDIPLD